MKVNQKILSIPPYISTSWKNVTSLHLEEKMEEDGAKRFLLIGLVNGSQIVVPEPSQDTLDMVFVAYEKHLEQEPSPIVGQKKSFSFPDPLALSPSYPPNEGSVINDPLSLFSLPIRLGVTGSLHQLLQHSPEASNSPDLPKELLEKIAELSKNLGMEQENTLPKPEPHCNCTHCQIMRAIRSSEKEASSTPASFKDEIEIEVKDEELRFKEWNIDPLSPELYLVSNPLNEKEHYSVFLGNPIGCTCGQSKCAHIKAVLHS